MGPYDMSKKGLERTPKSMEPGASKSLLTIKNLKKSYQGTPVLRDLSFDIHPRSIREGEVVGLLGPNGAGKTTAFYITMGLIQAEAGEVWFKGHNVTRLAVHERARLGMGYLAQEPSIFRSLTVEDNILCILETRPYTAEERTAKLQELLRELHLDTLAKKKAATLSGGERRRLEITRALVTEPLLLLLDEPFASIDPLAIADLKKLILYLKKKGISVLITDHNAREIFSIVDRSYLIREGLILTSGSPEELLRSPQARRYYFGEEFTI